MSFDGNVDQRQHHGPSCGRTTDPDIASGCSKGPAIITVKTMTSTLTLVVTQIMDINTDPD